MKNLSNLRLVCKLWKALVINYLSRSLNFYNWLKFHFMIETKQLFYFYEFHYFYFRFFIYKQNYLLKTWSVQGKISWMDNKKAIWNFLESILKIFWKNIKKLIETQNIIESDDDFSSFHFVFSIYSFGKRWNVFSLFLWRLTLNWTLELNFNKHFISLIFLCTVFAHK